MSAILADPQAPRAGAAGSEPTTESVRRQAVLQTYALQDAIFNSANFSSIATDAKGVIQIFNVGAERMLGYAAADVVNKVTPAEISDPEEVVARAAALSLELGETITPGFEALVFKASRGIEDIYDLTYIRKDGSRFPAVVSVTALRDAQEGIIGYLLIGTDNTARKEVVTELKRIERALQEKNIELEHASRMKSEFLATMSHELRTPLNAIIGFSEALKDGLVGTLSATQQEYIGDIFNSGQHLLALINDILDLSKVEAGMMELELETVDIKALLASSLVIVKGKAGAQRVALELDAADGLGLAALDVRKTKQIVYNLLSNAVKFSARGGRVVLRARRVARDAVGKLPGAWPTHGFALPAGEHESFLEIQVLDTGIGISPPNMARLFQAFSQIDSRLSRKFEGTGLGLAMVKQMAELHGGTVALSSAEGEGACFAAWLPLRPMLEDARIAQGKPAQILVLPGKRFALVVEDDDVSADLMRLLLEAEGFSVVRATCGEDGLALAARHSFSLITLDLRLPGMNGWDFLLLLRDNPALASIPVVVIAGEADRNLALVRGASAAVQKPVSRALLQSSLANLGLHPAQDRTHTVLVVDDDPKAVEVMAAFLPSPAYAVVRAYGGAEAIILAQRLRPDLVLLDLMMPEVSGFDVVDALQRHPDTTAIPILVVTAKHITAQDRASLGGNPGNPVQIVEKSGFNGARFLAQVKRVLKPN